MIKNIVFDFGNVIIKWDINSILEKYAIHDVESKKLKEIIFESEEWLQLDEGIINKGQAEKIFQDKAPDNLKNQVREIMNTWFEKFSLNPQECFFIDVQIHMS